MKNTLETRLGLFFALAMIAAVILLEMVGGIELFSHGRRITARFATAQELKPGDPVKMAGVQVGRVENVDIAEGQVLVSMKLNEKYARQVRTDSVATIKFLGLLGQNYVALSFGAKGAPVEENFSITTSEQPDLSQLMARIDNVAKGIDTMTSSFSGESFQNLLSPFTEFMQNNKDRFGGILINVSNITAQVASGQGTVGRLIYDDVLHKETLATITNFNATAAEARHALDQARDVIAKIQAGQGTIGKLTTDDALYKEATVAVTNLKEILQKMNQGQGSVGKLINDESLFKNAKLTLQKLDKATEGLEDQGPLSVLGMAVGNLF